MADLRLIAKQTVYCGPADPSGVRMSTVQDFRIEPTTMLLADTKHEALLTAQAQYRWLGGNVSSMNLHTALDGMPRRLCAHMCNVYAADVYAMSER